MLIENIFLKIKKRITEVDYNRYIANLEYKEKLSNIDLYVFEAKNPFIAKWVKTKYSDLIKSLIESELNSKVSLDFITRGKIKFQKTGENKKQSSFLNPSLVFESFIVGESNHFAYTASLNTAKEPGVLFNPLFIYGDAGLGKTHLLQAIGNYNLYKNKIVIYTTIEQFMNDFTYNLKKNSMEQFKAKYRECDILLIDDVQFVSKKEKLQEEFFHTFNEIHSKKGQIVLTADMHPKKIEGLEERLRSRFEWGMIIDIQPSDIKTRIEIIRKKCEIDKIEIDDSVIKYIATHLDSNIREIEGALIQLNARARWGNQKITINLAKETIEEYMKDKQEDVNVDRVVEIVARELGIRVNDIKSKNRSPQVAKARRIIIYLTRELTITPTPLLAQIFSLKDHSSISHTIKRFKSEMAEDETLELLVTELRSKIVNK